MGRRVKCQVTGEYGDSDEYVKINSKYYKSQEVYDEFKRQNELRQQIIYVIADQLLGYEKGQVFPTLMLHRLKELDFYPNEVILETIQKIQNSLSWTLQHKDFKSDTNRINYIFAAIKNHINDTYKDYKAKKHEEYQDSVIDHQLFEFADMETNTTAKPMKQKTTDISWAFED